MTDLVAFLRARLDEDEERARKALTPGVYRWVDIHDDLESMFSPTGDFAEELPKRILAEAAAKRAILERYASAPDWTGGEDVRILASVYSGHPDYDPAWSTP